MGVSVVTSVTARKEPSVSGKVAIVASHCSYLYKWIERASAAGWPSSERKMRQAAKLVTTEGAPKCRGLAAASSGVE